MTQNTDRIIDWPEFYAHLEAHIQKYAEEVIEKNLEEMKWHQ